jgi:threonine/homoserine/homoserine lactone efflux protein
LTPEQWWGAALFMLVSSITPGPNNTMLMASGVHFGYRRTLAHLMGVQLGFGFMLIAVGLGLHAVLSQFPAFYDVVRFAGGAYMVWMAWSLASARPQLAAHTAQGASGYGATQAFEDEVCQPQAVIASAAKHSKDYGESSKPGLPPRAATSEAVPTQATTAQNERQPLGFWGAVLFQWVNPKAWVMAVTIMSAYVPPGAGLLQIAPLGLMFAVLGFPCSSVWVGFGSALRSYLQDAFRMRVFNCSMAAALLASLYPMLTG